jgi:hypothetical protein
MVLFQTDCFRQVADANLPMPPRPLPNPFSSEQGQKKRGFKVNSASDLLFEINGVSQVVNP